MSSPLPKNPPHNTYKLTSCEDVSDVRAPLEVVSDDADKPLTPAERKARWKERKEAGRFCVVIDVGERLTDALCTLRWLDASDCYRRAVVQKAVQRFLDAVPRVTRSGSD